MSSYDPYASPDPNQPGDPSAQPPVEPPAGQPVWQPGPTPYGQPGEPSYGQPPAPPYGQPAASPYGQQPAAQPYGAPQYPGASQYPPVSQFGAPQYGAAPQYAAYGYQSGKSFVVTWLLAAFLGGLGIDRFYLGKIGTGVLKLVTLGGCGIWSLIDLILVLAGVTRDKDGLQLAGYQEHKRLAWIITIVLWILGIPLGIANAHTFQNSFQNSLDNGLAPTGVVVERAV